MPVRINQLADLSANLWWSWHRDARDMFNKIDRRLWQVTGHNPVKMLYDINPGRLEILATDPEFLEIYDDVIASFGAEISGSDAWLAREAKTSLSRPVAYFSMEFAVHNSLPIYAGGLGVLAGDTCKEASDLGIPFVGVGFMYPEGYFHQRISEDGWQTEDYLLLDFERAPISRVCTADGQRLLLNLSVGDRQVYVAAWQVLAGSSKLYLLDTNVPENDLEDRGLSARLYSPGKEMRLQQEYLLGFGGVMLLRALGIEPAVWHCNEGHTAFLLIARLKEYMTAGHSRIEAEELVRRCSVFTTHTPVPAGHDVFELGLIDRYFSWLWNKLGITREELISLGQVPGGQDFNMTVLGLKLAASANGVSQVHGEVSRNMWRSLYPGRTAAEVPIRHITNGVHIPTWVAPEIARLYEEYVDKEWYRRQDDAGLWESRVPLIPDEELWHTHQGRKQRLLHYIRERVRRDWKAGVDSAPRLAAMGAMLDPEVLTVGFVRRFVEYKRPTLLFRDLEQLKELIRDSQRPVQFIFAGKSHPADSMAKELIHRVYTQAKENDFEGRLCFVEDYDLHLAHYLVQGVDVWLNSPRRWLEASGTSGMKAAVNGVPNLSVRDGWWHEGFNGKNGWAIGDISKPESVDEEDALDAGALLYVLKELVVPKYYDRNLEDIPLKWMAVVKESVSTVLPHFAAARMMKEYTREMYLPLI
ncbi:alpha-glucan family phosphorylase [Candidatus Dehalogenimonas loeffleri]|uniref:Alpha-glucan family phosphorylase n=1 Tax=Candidatus Dehalogenimonas loeffleri TaxID=3127115 RepID=A0ABZ2J7Q7_9CHLR